MKDRKKIEKSLEGQSISIGLRNVIVVLDVSMCVPWTNWDRSRSKENNFANLINVRLWCKVIRAEYK